MVTTRRTFLYRALVGISAGAVAPELLLAPAKVTTVTLGPANATAFTLMVPSHKMLAELATRMDPDGKIAIIVKLLSEQNALLDDIPWREGDA